MAGTNDDGGEAIYMLEIKNLTFRAKDGGQADILHEVSLAVEDGTFLVVTGPNGGGKTTLARAIMGLIEPTSGQILYNGTDITRMSITERARLGMSYGFQQPPRFKGMRVKDLICLASGDPHMPDFDCCQYLNKVGLCAADYVDREVDTSLSGGEVKRIEIATILARKSPLMIFDEPEAGIDLWSFSKLTETFRALHKKRESTIIVISHQERIIDLADEIVVLSGGEVEKRGPKDEILPTILADTEPVCRFQPREARA
jgi:Fe-S cluster assembly ATP-binding protein